jgi:hypothetical protein
VSEPASEPTSPEVSDAAESETALPLSPPPPLSLNVTGLDAGGSLVSGGFGTRGRSRSGDAAGGAGAVSAGGTARAGPPFPSGVLDAGGDDPFGCGGAVVWVGLPGGVGGGEDGRSDR